MYEHYGHDYGATSDPSVRAADADREATAERLRRHHGEGRIDVTEFQDRLDRAYHAKTIGELHQLLSDLPRDRQPEPLGLGPHPRSLRMLPWVGLLFLIIAISALAGDHHHHAGLWVLIPLFLVARLLFWGHRPWRRGRYL
jgi:hypothetical protein